LSHAILSGNVGQGCRNCLSALDRATNFCNRSYH